MKYSQLSRVHPEARLDVLRRYEDLFEGGESFRARVADYLPRHDVEPPAVYKRRCEQSHYLNYCARIVRWFAAALFSCPPTPTSKPDTSDLFWSEFKEDADGRGTDLDVVMREAFVRALVGGRSWVRVEFPEPGEEPLASLADAERAGLRRARLVSVPTASVRHWRRLPDGSLAWVLEHTRDEALSDLDEAEEVIETWTQWYADGSARRWQTRYSPKSRPSASDDVPEIAPPRSPCGAIPLVELCLPPELHLLAHVAEPQLEHFRKRNALSWAIDRTCYAMPVLYLKNGSKPPTMGPGYYLKLAVNEKMDWPAPPAAPFEVVQGVARELVQEIHRVVEQMALAVDNNAAAAVGRSGESKAADGLATQVVLPAFGERVREALEKILDLVARGRGDGDLVWSVGGMNRYDLADASALTDMALASDPLGIPSVTYRRELFKAVTRAQLPHLDEDTRKAIDSEIDNGVFDEDVARTPTPTPTPTGTGTGTGAEGGDDPEGERPPPQPAQPPPR